MSTILRSFGLAVAAALAAAATAPEMHPGDQSGWSLDFRVRLEQGSGRPVQIHLSGDWISTVSAVRSGEYDSQLEIANVRFTGEAVESAAGHALEELRRRHDLFGPPTARMVH